MINVLETLLFLAFGTACFLVYLSMKDAAEAARGTSRYLVVGAFRSLLAAFSLAGVLLGLARFLGP